MNRCIEVLQTSPLATWVRRQGGTRIVCDSFRGCKCSGENHPPEVQGIVDRMPVDIVVEVNKYIQSAVKIATDHLRLRAQLLR